MESHNIYSSESGPSVQHKVCKIHPVLILILFVHLLLCAVLRCEYNMLYLFHLLLKGIWIVSRFGLLWIIPVINILILFFFFFF